MIQGGFGDRAHQSDRTAAIDQADLVLAKDLAEFDGGFDETGIGAGTGAAIDTYVVILLISAMWHCSVNRVKTACCGRDRNLPLNGGNRRKNYSARVFGERNGLYEGRMRINQKIQAAPQWARRLAPGTC